jgi:C-terminal peptidase prc
MEDAWQLLDIYFVFRDRMPADPHIYHDPGSLYASVRERWTVYFDKQDALAFLDMLSTKSGGIGIFVDSVGPGILVKDVFAGSPGQSAGLLKGDTITAVNDTACLGRTFESQVNMLGGDIGQTKRLTIRRGSQELTVSVVLGEYLAPSVIADSLDSNVAYIGISIFSETTVDTGGTRSEFRAALQQTAWAPYTILDLRENGGGSVDQCLGVLRELVPAGTAAIHSSERQMRTRAGTSGAEYYGITADTVWRTEGQGNSLSRRFYVLVDTFTASASEVVVSCLRDNRAGSVVSVGTRTYGKGRAQYLFGINDSNELYLSDSGLAKITFSRLTPVVGAPYDSVGIYPDHLVPSGGDILDTAMALIGQGGLTKSLWAASRTAYVKRCRQTLVRPRWEPLAVVRGRRP